MPEFNPYQAPQSELHLQLQEHSETKPEAYLGRLTYFINIGMVTQFILFVIFPRLGTQTLTNSPNGIIVDFSMWGILGANFLLGIPLLVIGFWHRLPWLICSELCFIAVPLGFLILGNT